MRPLEDTGRLGHTGQQSPAPILDVPVRRVGGIGEGPVARGGNDGDPQVGLRARTQADGTNALDVAVVGGCVAGVGGIPAQDGDLLRDERRDEVEASLDEEPRRGIGLADHQRPDAGAAGIVCVSLGEQPPTPLPAGYLVLEHAVHVEIGEDPRIDVEPPVRAVPDGEAEEDVALAGRGVEGALGDMEPDAFAGGRVGVAPGDDPAAVRQPFHLAACVEAQVAAPILQIEPAVHVPADVDTRQHGLLADTDHEPAREELRDDPVAMPRQSSRRAGELRPVAGAELGIAGPELGAEPPDVARECGHGQRVAVVGEPSGRPGLQLAVHPPSLVGEGEELEVGGLHDRRAEGDVAVTHDEVLDVVLKNERAAEIFGDGIREHRERVVPPAVPVAQPVGEEGAEEDELVDGRDREPEVGLAVDGGAASQRGSLVEPDVASPVSASDLERRKNPGDREVTEVGVLIEKFRTQPILPRLHPEDEPVLGTGQEDGVRERQLEALRNRIHEDRLVHRRPADVSAVRPENSAGDRGQLCIGGGAA